MPKVFSVDSPLKTLRKHQLLGLFHVPKPFTVATWQINVLKQTQNARLIEMIHYLMRCVEALAESLLYK